MDVVLCLGFDLFLKPRILEAARRAGVEARFEGDGAGAARVLADVSTQGVEERLRALRAARPDLPLVACYPHVEAERAERVRELGGTPMPRGAFMARIEELLRGAA